MSGDFVEKLLNAGSTPDWISPLWAIIQDFRNRPYHRIYVDRNSSWSAKDLVKILKQGGVKVWGETLLDEMIVVTVRRQQARWADYILRRAEVPLLNTVQNNRR